MWKYIRLKASTTKLLEKKNFIHISLLTFSSRNKMMET